MFLIHIHSAVPQHSELTPEAQKSAFWSEMSGEIVLNRSTLGRLHCHCELNKEQDQTPGQSVSVAYHACHEDYIDTPAPVLSAVLYPFAAVSGRPSVIDFAGNLHIHSAVVHHVHGPLHYWNLTG